LPELFFALVYRDMARLQPVILSMLEKMYTEKFIYPADAAAFDETLSTHHRATGSDGTTYVQKAIIEHNIQAASKAYLNISFTSLGEILGIPATKTERIASKMIAESRLAASIDQVRSIFAQQQE
jgi:COP9 signalosome complex subunit 4